MLMKKNRSHDIEDVKKKKMINDDDDKHNELASN